MALTLTIGGVNYTAYADFTSLIIQDSIRARTDTMTVDLRVPISETATVLALNQAGSSAVTLTDGAFTEFGGVVQRVKQSLGAGPGYLRYTLSCSDYTPWLDRRLVTTILPEMTVDNMVKTVLYYADPLVVFTVNNVQSSTVTLAEQFLEYEAPSAILDRLAQMVEYQWYIDYEKDLHFFPFEQNPAPLTTLNLDTDYALYSGFEWEEDVSQVHNVAYLKDYLVQVDPDPSQSWAGNGVQGFFALDYQPKGIDGTTVTMGGTPLAVEDNATQKDESGKAYLEKYGWGLRLSTPDTTASNGKQISITYPGYSPLNIASVVAPDSIDIMRQREGGLGGGVHEVVLSMPDQLLPSQSAVEDWGRVMLNRYQYPLETCSFKTFFKGIQHWRAGQYITVISSTRGISTLFFITSVTKRARIPASTGPAGDTMIEYAIEGASTPWGL